MFNYRKKEHLVTQVLSWTVFLGCFSGFCYQGYKCIQQYLDGPQAIQISMKKQTQVEFPSITFCPLPYFGNSVAFNWTELSSCGIDSKDIWNIGKFIDTDLCNDTKELWTNVTPNLENLGIKNVVIGLFQAWNNYISLPIDEKIEMWKKVPGGWRGSCYTLTLPKNITEIGVMSLTIESEPNKTFTALFHPAGMLNQFNTKISPEFVDIMIQPGQGALHQLSYHQTVKLNFGNDTCSHEKHEFSTCLDEAIKKV